jgi:hypothetical protein
LIPERTNCDTELLELNEFLRSNTIALITVEPKKLCMLTREMLYGHRWDVFNWLIMNGVKIPHDLLLDARHPRPGAQSPDQSAGAAIDKPIAGC